MSETKPSEDERVVRVGGLGEAILAVLEKDSRQHGPSFETSSLQLDALAGVAIALARSAPTPTFETALRERFVSLFRKAERLQS